MQEIASKPPVMAFNGGDLGSCLVIEGSGFNIILAIKRSRLLGVYSDLGQISPVFKTKGHSSNIHSKS
jgi:hypothetical protein